MESSNDSTEKIRVITFSPRLGKCESSVRKFSNENDSIKSNTFNLLDSIESDMKDESSNDSNCSLDIKDNKKPCYKCKSCGTFFSTNLGLTQHKLLHKKNSFQCDVCKKQFSSLAVLQIHKFKHKNKSSDWDSDDNSTERFSCLQCDEYFSTLQELKRHKQMHDCDDDDDEEYVDSEIENGNSNDGVTHFECEFCRKFLPSLRHLKEHRLSHLSEKQYKCYHCDKSFARRNALNEHLRSHTNERPFECDICGKNFVRSAVLQKHKLVHSVNYVKCESCGYSCVDKDELAEHMETHKTQDALECEFCDMVFYRKSLLLRHTKRVHHRVKDFACTVCKKSFFLQRDLIMHMRTHTGEKPFSCSVCKKSFSVVSNLKRHEKLHTGIKPFKCKECHKCFSAKSILDEHIRVHTGEKPFECEVCHSKFTQRGSLIEHRRIHTGEKPYECSFCQKRFYQRGYLNKHFRTHTGEKPYECSICHKCFARLDLLKVHEKIHSGIKAYVCDKCAKAFVTRSELTKHLKCHKPVPGSIKFQCEPCQLEFVNDDGLQQHMSLHVAEESIQPMEEDDEKVVLIAQDYIPENPSADENVVISDSGSKSNFVSHTLIIPKETQVYYYNPKKNDMKGKNFVPMVASKTLFRCDICEAEFDKESSLHEHMKAHAPEKILQTKNSSQPTESVPNRHVKEASKTLPAPQPFVTGQLNVQINNGPKVNTYKIVLADKNIPKNHSSDSNEKSGGSRKYQAVMHRNVNDVIEPEEPVITGTLNLQIYNGTNISTYEIILSDKTCPNKMEPQHLETYAETLHACAFCPLHFTDVHSLKKHELLHSMQGLYQCNECYKFFASDSALDNHLKLHSLETSLKCSHCNGIFLDAAALIEHQKTHENIQCTFCSEIFTSEMDLNLHLKIHTEAFQCDVCGQVFVSESECVEHASSHLDKNEDKQENRIIIVEEVTEEICQYADNVEVVSEQKTD